MGAGSRTQDRFHTVKWARVVIARGYWNAGTCIFVLCFRPLEGMGKLICMIRCRWDNCRVNGKRAGHRARTPRYGDTFGKKWYAQVTA